MGFDALFLAVHVGVNVGVKLGKVGHHWHFVSLDRKKPRSDQQSEERRTNPPWGLSRQSDPRRPMAGEQKQVILEIDPPSRHDVAHAVAHMHGCSGKRMHWQRVHHSHERDGQPQSANWQETHCLHASQYVSPVH